MSLEIVEKSPGLWLVTSIEMCRELRIIHEGNVVAMTRTGGYRGRTLSASTFIAQTLEPKVTVELR